MCMFVTARLLPGIITAKIAGVKQLHTPGYTGFSNRCGE